MEYEQSECIAGTDTVCGSCEVCEWTSDAMELGCKDTPLWWKWQNCWSTRVDEENFQRNLVDLEDLRIDTREGRRHWVWDVSIPAVSGYTQGDWTGE